MTRDLKTVVSDNGVMSVGGITYHGSRTTNPTWDGAGDFYYNSIWKTQVQWNGTTIRGFDEIGDYIASSASNQTGITTLTKMTNNIIGVGTNITGLRYYSSLWDATNSRVRGYVGGVLSNFGIMDNIFFDVGMDATTGSPNTRVEVIVIGFTSAGVEIFRKTISTGTYAAAGTHKISRTTEIYVGPEIGAQGYFEIHASAESSTTFSNKSFKFRYDHR